VPEAFTAAISFFFTWISWVSMGVDAGPSFRHRDPIAFRCRRMIPAA
jgi:hypothetical protein